jgi:hypothetical protein
MVPDPLRAFRLKVGDHLLMDAKSGYLRRGGPAWRMMELMLDEIASLPTLARDLPMPRDPRLTPLCHTVRADPGTTRTLGSWARDAGASSRTLARLAAGASVTRIAPALRYDRPRHARPCSSGPSARRRAAMFSRGTP